MKNDYDDHAVEAKASRFALMISPSGFAINIIQHIRTAK